MPIWSDFFKLFTYEAENDPLSAKKDPRNFGTAGITQPEAMSSDYSATGGGLSSQSSFRQTYDMIDTTSLANRAMRYKEYERLRNVPEVEMTMTLFSDEACVAGDTLVATPFGFITIKDLAEKKSDERFLVYCYDFRKKDYTLGWAYAPRLVKTSPTMTVVLDNGKTFTATEDHRVLLRDGNWIETGRLEIGDELMPFYKVPAKTQLTKQKQNQFPRIYSHTRGWIHERQFLDDWKTSKTDQSYEKVNKAVRMIGAGIGCRQIAKQMGHDWKSIEDWFQKAGFSHREIKSLYRNEDRRTIVDIYESPSQPVYDISVDQHQCFATDSVILHNCQKDEKGNIFKIITKNDEVREELEFLLLNRKMLNFNRNGWIWFKNLCIFGDWFVELVINPDNPKEGIYRAEPLPVEQMYRIQTVNNKIIEFQQSKEGPDYQAISSGNVVEQNDMELSKTTAIRFAPNQIVHFRLGDDKKTFFPYGQSLVEPARAPAHTLRLMEDAMVTYRLTRAPERRIFYVDCGQLPPFKAEAFMERMKDNFRKRKIANNRGGSGANGVEERWQPPAQDEDYWVPIRPNSNTRIETLPGAENLGEIDDAVYFRNKLLTALNMPKNYFNNEDVAATKLTVSANDSRFARMIERLQSSFEDGVLELAERHLHLRGFPEESFRDLKIKMTPPSDWREQSKAEVVSQRYANAGTLKGGQLMSDFDIYIDIFKFNEEEAEEKLARLKIQKLEDLKLQILAQNPQLLGIGVPGQEQTDQEIGSEPGGPAGNIEPGDMSAPDMSGMPQDMGGLPAPTPETSAKESPSINSSGASQETSLPEPSEEEIKKYDLEIQDYEADQDKESIDFSVGD
jgi:hypothetical protein